jgi:hypothetical protein
MSNMAKQTTLEMFTAPLSGSQVSYGFLYLIQVRFKPVLGLAYYLSR